MKGKGWGAAIESTSESSKTNHLLLGSRACDLRPFPWKSSVQAACGAWLCCSTSFALLLHLQQMFKHLGPCPLHVLPSTGTLAPHGHLLWHGLAPVPVWSESCGHYSPVCSFRVYVQMLCKSCPVPCLILWWGWRTRPAPARYCPMLWGGFLVSDMSTSSKKLHTLLFLLDKAPALLCCPAWSWRRKGQGDRWQQHEEPGKLCAPKARHCWGSGVVVRLSCLRGICKHSNGVKNRHGTKAVCQPPHHEGRTLPFPLGLLSIQISFLANDFLGHVILAWSKSVMKH